MLDFNPELIKDRFTRPFKSAEAKADDWKKPRSHHGILGHFENPWPSGQQSAGLPNDFPLTREEDIPQTIKRIKVVKPSFSKEVNSNELQTTWLGHAGVTVQMPRFKKLERPLTLIIDPIFSDRASPMDSAGPSRRLENPCAIEDLPKIDFLFISHNHYDHMCADTLEVIFKRSCRTTRYIVPLGIKKWFEAYEGVPKDQVIEMDWWQEEIFDHSHIDSEVMPHEDLGLVKITCVPAQHASARSGADKNATLWAGYIIEQNATKHADAPERTCVYFAGDTGYRGAPDGESCPAFKQIGEKFGPIDFSAIPIWRGGTLSFITKHGVRLDPESGTLALHATPEDAVAIHRDVKSRHTLGVHHAVFAGDEDEATWPISLLEQACRDSNVPTEILEVKGVGIFDVGATMAIPVLR